MTERTCPLSAGELQPLLQELIQLQARGAELIDGDGGVRASVGAPGAPTARETTWQAPIVVRGHEVALLRTVGPTGLDGVLEPAVRLLASHVSTAWSLGSEVDSLAGEVVRAYTEIHVIHGLGEALTTELSVSGAAEYILKLLMDALQASWTSITMHEPGAPATLRIGAQTEEPGDPERAREDGRLIERELRSAGRPVGIIAAGRTLAHQRKAFSSVEAKLLDAVAALAGNALRNSQLYEELRQKTDTLQERELYLQSVLENVADGIITVDVDGIIRSVNPAAERTFGYRASEVEGESIDTLLPAIWQDKDGGLTRMRRLGTGLREVVGLRREGTTFPAEMTFSAMHLKAERLFIMSVRDVSARRRAEEALAHQALHDGLTDLPNRTLLWDRLELTVRTARRGGEPLALLVMDLDRFKDVNDTFGHHTGDELLKQASQRLRAALRETDTIARLGGDEFAVLLPDADVERATQIARRLLLQMDSPFTVDGRDLRVGASIGISLCPDHAVDAAALLQCADVAMYVAKRTGVGISVYTSQQDDYRNGRLTLLNELRDAIDGGQLKLVFQPKVSCDDSGVLCAEALVRWEHPERGTIHPDQFIPLAEETGLIKQLSRWVLKEALRRCHEWQADGLNAGVAVNLSMRDLHDADLPQLISDMLCSEGVAPGHLVVEVTESMLMADPQRALEVVERLCEIGVKIAIDDFGMGYSSLAYLRRLPVHEIKIDREFVRHMVEDRSDAAIVRSTIGLGHDLGLTVVAEGVEDLATCGLLARLGCDAAQGFYLGQPMEPAAFAEWAVRQSEGAGLTAVA